MQALLNVECKSKTGDLQSSCNQQLEAQWSNVGDMCGFKEGHRDNSDSEPYYGGNQQSVDLIRCATTTAKVNCPQREDTGGTGVTLG